MNVNASLNINSQSVTNRAGGALRAAGQRIAGAAPANTTETRTGFVATTSDEERGWFSTTPGRQGYAVDVNGNGRYDRGADAVVVVDGNGDGRISEPEAQGSANIMKSMTNNFDFDNDGKVADHEATYGNALRQHFYNRVDSNRDGRVTAQEMERGGVSLWVDRNADGAISEGEGQSISQLPGGGRLQSIDPFRGRVEMERSPQNAPGSGLWSFLG